MRSKLWLRASCSASSFCCSFFAPPPNARIDFLWCTMRRTNEAATWPRAVVECTGDDMMESEARTVLRADLRHPSGAK
eukprot:6453093-Prymnesium_polylepis.1